ncbi:MAG TPA: NAD(+) synthase, partial [Phytomonospora sp.]
ENVYAVSMPSRYSSEHSRDDAADLAKRTGINYLSEPIEAIMDAYLGQITLDGLALENVQPRIRGLILMGLSNQHGHLVLAPGNKTEYATGYSTLYGDTVGGYAPIKDVMKLMIFALANWRNEEAGRRGETPPIPVNTIVKPPSAELREEQQDTDSLPPYEILDPIVEGYVDGDLGRAGLIAAGHEAELVDRVIKLIDRAEYKRRQTAPGPKISVKNFGRDRRLPITNRWVEKA